MTIFSHRWRRAQLLVRRSEDELVLLLRGAQRVPVQLVVSRLIFARHVAGLGIAVVPETAGVVLPRDAGELAPLQLIVQVLAIRDAPDANDFLVAAALRHAVRNVLA